ncbi:MAG: acyl--CoA ligase [Chitinispirillaceae bacterium]|nr:acyl--CoA ligase [Chitinispirillaceae bacterium]
MTNDTLNSISVTLQNHATVNPDKTMLMVDGERLSYGGFEHEVERLAAAFVFHGTGPGDCVALIMPNSIDWYIAFWAAVRCGARPVPLDPQTGEWELQQFFILMKFSLCCIVRSYRANPLRENVLAVTEEMKIPTAVIVMDAQTETAPLISRTGVYPPDTKEYALPAMKNTQPGELLMYACTSGTTGNPKILAVEHAGFYRSQRDMAVYLGLGPTDIMLLGMPLYHQGGFGMGVQMLLPGGTALYQSRFDPESFIRTVQRQQVTVVQLTATLAKILISHPAFKRPAIDSLRIAYFAGELLPDEVAEKFYRDFGIRVVNIIGSSETGTMAVWDSRCDTDCSVNDFRPMPFTDVILRDDAGGEPPEGEPGVLQVRTDAVLLEYFGNISLTREKIIIRDGKRWFDTGDCGIRLPDGRIRLMGRRKRIIKRGGNLIYPEEIEAFLLTHPRLHAVAVNGEPHEIFGEMIVAHVQPSDGAQLTGGELVRFCRGKLSSYKIPDRFVVTEELPKDIGKIQFKYIR